MHTPDIPPLQNSAAPQVVASLRPDYERSDLGIRSILVFFLVIVVGIASMQLGLRKMLTAFQSSALDQREVRPRLSVSPPKPQLQSQPLVDYSHHLHEQVAKLQSYGWIDKRKGIVRIPISRALDIIAERGMPKVPEPMAASKPGNQNRRDSQDNKTRNDSK